MPNIWIVNIVIILANSFLTIPSSRRASVIGHLLVMLRLYPHVNESVISALYGVSETSHVDAAACHVDSQHVSS
ncbi:TPA: hypothetical protein DCZ39_07730 [Patescibacteria group bacterium]|nr:hypothetical protein [Candidatus Gracilibacteria bacterium]